MPWILVDLALVLLAVVGLAVAGLRVWRGVKALGREVAASGQAVGAAGETLSRLQQQAAPPAGRTSGAGAPQRLP